MSEKLNKTPKEYKNKRLNLRDHDKKNQKKKKAGSAGSVSKYDDERLQFINDSFEERESISSLNAGNVLDVNGEDNLEMEKFSESSTSSPPQMSLRESSLKQPLQEGHLITPNQTQGTSQVKKEKRDSLAEELRIYRDERKKLSKEISELSNTPVHMFFRSMADVVCQFPPGKIAKMRRKVSNIVTEMELSILAEIETPSSTTQDSDYQYNIQQQPCIGCCGMHPNNSQRLIPCPIHSCNIPQQPMHPNNSQGLIPCPIPLCNIPPQPMHQNNSQRLIPCPIPLCNIPQGPMHPNNSQGLIPYPIPLCNIPQPVMHPNNYQRLISCPTNSSNISQQPMHPNNSQLQEPSQQHSLNTPQQVTHQNNSQPETPSPQHSLKHTTTSNAPK